MLQTTCYTNHILDEDEEVEYDVGYVLTNEEDYEANKEEVDFRDETTHSETEHVSSNDGSADE